MSRILGPTRNESLRLTLNTDGRRHPIENVLTVSTLALGLVALVTGLIVETHAIACWAGLLGFLIGLESQYVSATTPERALNIVGIVGSFVGAALGIYHGGFLP
ncbi:hypothetical protein AB0K60_24960 [Thermopolyspora sp. NPDC052614]|uniref:hypothetical protein n=1 Tax=Thermopolyspora sp. NPDC052614 TaxID=3155682 RepID=UPI0034297206